MRIGIIGAGMIGETCAALFARAGHSVVLSNSRGPQSLQGTADELGPNVRAGTVEDAASFGELVLLAIPLKAFSTVPKALLAGKIVVDAMNYYPGRDGELDFGARSSSRFVADALPDAEVVKAFNTMYFQTLRDQAKPGAPMDERLALFVAADDDGAGARVSKLIEQIGFAPVATGNLEVGSRKQQPGTPVYNRPLQRRDALQLLHAHAG